MTVAELERARVPPSRRTHASRTSWRCARRAAWSCSGWCAGRLLPRPRRTRGGRPARAARGRLRAQRKSSAGTARGRPDALDGRLRGAPRTHACGRVGARHSWQAHLVVGALPERMQFPGARAELMFAPVESLPFGDRPVPERALPAERAGVRLARRRIQDADQILRAESGGEQGVSDLGLRAHPGGKGPARATCRRPAGRRCCARRSR